MAGKFHLPGMYLLPLLFWGVEVFCGLGEAAAHRVEGQAGLGLSPPSPQPHPTPRPRARPTCDHQADP